MQTELKSEQQEEWRPITDYEGLYEVSNQGRVRSVDRVRDHGVGGLKRVLKGRILKPWVLSRRGEKTYHTVGLSKDCMVTNKPIHRLVCGAFHPNPNNYPCVNHIDGNKLNNHASNLEHCSFSQNNQHAFDSGLKPPTVNHGEASGTHKLKNAQVLEIRRRYDDKASSYQDLAEEYRMNKSTMHRIVTRRTWMHI